MKKIGFLLFPFLLLSCKQKKNVPDVSHISVDLKIDRFDNDFFSVDSNQLPRELQRLQTKYPEVLPVFLYNILGAEPEHAEEAVRSFLQLGSMLRDTIGRVFKNTIALEKDLIRAFQYVRYYFPAYQPPRVVTVAGPVDALAMSDAGPTPCFLRPGWLGISLQFYLGQNFSVYHDPFFIQQVAPQYRSRRFSPEYIISDAMQVLCTDLFPDLGKDKPLIEQMVQRGKQWYLLDQLLPFVPDSVKTGYTQKQINWCAENEGAIWTEIVKSEDLNSLNPAVIQTYIGEGPFTQGFSPEYSPGNLGPWLGWQIIKKFVSKNPGLKPEVVMQTPARKILEEAKYKPR